MPEQRQTENWEKAFQPTFPKNTPRRHSERLAIKRSTGSATNPTVPAKNPARCTDFQELMTNISKSPHLTEYEKHLLEALIIARKGTNIWLLSSHLRGKLGDVQDFCNASIYYKFFAKDSINKSEIFKDFLKFVWDKTIDELERELYTHYARDLSNNRHHFSPQIYQSWTLDEKTCFYTKDYCIDVKMDRVRRVLRESFEMRSQDELKTDEKVYIQWIKKHERGKFLIDLSKEHLEELDHDFSTIMRWIRDEKNEVQTGNALVLFATLWATAYDALQIMEMTDRKDHLVEQVVSDNLYQRLFGRGDQVYLGPLACKVFEFITCTPHVLDFQDLLHRKGPSGSPQPQRTTSTIRKRKRVPSVGSPSVGSPSFESASVKRRRNVHRVPEPKGDPSVEGQGANTHYEDQSPTMDHAAQPDQARPTKHRDVHPGQADTNLEKLRTKLIKKIQEALKALPSGTNKTDYTDSCKRLSQGLMDRITPFPCIKQELKTYGKTLGYLYAIPPDQLKNAADDLRLIKVAFETDEIPGSSEFSE